jgi:hypothetical protein
MNIGQILPNGHAYFNIPEELRNRNQWCVADPNKAPIYGTYDSELGYVVKAASVTDPATWMTFDEACRLALSCGFAIGYVLSAADPFACIDLDVKNEMNEVNQQKWTPQANLERYWKIVEYFDSFTEHSLSGQGVHIWVKGKIGQGCRRDGVEVYSQERFIICTGRVIHHKPVKQADEHLQTLVSEIRKSQGSTHVAELIDYPETEDDDTIFHRAMGAQNYSKFMALYEGRWEELGYPSQSEADLSLMSMFTFYSKSNAQCKRLFRRTALGRRDKAVKNDRYLDHTLTLIRGRMAHQQKADISAVLQAAEHAAKLQQERIQAIQNSKSYAPLPELDWPPGNTGRIARFIYHSSPRPVKLVSICGSLAFSSGISGKAWNIPGSGLNNYGILVARSGVGKESMHSGISYLIDAVSRICSAVGQFVSFNDFASGPALIKALAKWPCFVNIAGEFGHKFKLFGQEDKHDAMSTLRRIITDLYQKSGARSRAGGIAYSDGDKNIADIQGVAYSLFGETTPDTFYESMTPSMMADGFMSRFIVMEYEGDRPPNNENQILVPDDDLVSTLGNIVLQAHGLVTNGQVQYIARDPQAATLLDAFDKECDTSINSTTDEAFRQMWNRACLKALRIAGILAVMDNHLAPVITLEHAQWALDLIRRDIHTITRKLMSGDIGNDDGTRRRKLVATMKEFLTSEKNYGVDDVGAKLRSANIIPRQYLVVRLSNISCFRKHRLGSSAAINHTIECLRSDGVLTDVGEKELLENHSFRGKAFRLLRDL